MPVSVEVLHLSVVRPLVGHVEGGLHGAAVGVVTPLEQIFVELLVQVVHGIVEGEEDELRYLVRRISTRDISATAVAILQYKTCNWTGGASYRTIGISEPRLLLFFFYRDIDQHSNINNRDVS